jgi:hypothetical protein
VASAFLLFVWTVWLVVALCLLGSRRAILYVGAFAVPGLIVLFADGHAWRPYLMAWLGVHAVASGYYYLDSLYLESYHAGRNDVAQSTAREENYGGGNPRRIILSGVSYIGLVWLWVQGGALYWQYFTGVMAAIAATVVGTWLMRRAWKAYQGWIQRRVEAACAVVEQEAAAELAKQVGGLEQVIGQRDVLLQERNGQLRQARLQCQRQASELARAEQRIRHLSAEHERQENQLAMLREILREQREREKRMRDAERDLVSDMFSCTACESIWLITAEGDRRITRRPAGDGCDVCAGAGGDHDTALFRARS